MKFIITDSKTLSVQTVDTEIEAIRVVDQINSADPTCYRDAAGKWQRAAGCEAPAHYLSEDEYKKLVEECK